MNLENVLVQNINLFKVPIILQSLISNKKLIVNNLTLHNVIINNPIL
jgi:hypothetical protein